MFELSFIKKYLTPRRKQLSVSLIALLSVAVITLVVWLVVLFLSVTEGIERSWLHKLTALNAPLRLQPTKEYFNSYYYAADQYSASSNYLSKTLGEKASSVLSDPYNPEIDESLPLLMPRPDKDAQGNLKDPVKGVIQALEELKKSYPRLTSQDVELSGALLRLDLLRKEAGTLHPVEMQSHLTSVSYLATFSEKNPSLSELILPPTVKDLNHLLYLANQKGMSFSPLDHAQIKKLKNTLDLWRLPLDLLPEGLLFAAEAYLHEGEISHVMLPSTLLKKTGGSIEKRGSRIFYRSENEAEIPLHRDTPLFVYGNIDFDVTEVLDKDHFKISAKLQKHRVSGIVPMEGLEIADAAFETHFTAPPEGASPPWSYSVDGVSVLPSSAHHSGVLLAKNFRDNGVAIGDGGYLAYSSTTATGPKEMHIPIYVAGFYDPGIMAVGNKCILVPQKITRAVNASESAFTLDKSESNQFLVWFPHLKDAEKVKAFLIEKLEKQGLSPYWEVQTYREYPFAKDLMQQFQSDKYLFSLIGVIILLVACTNIISLLVLLVSDKKKEIGILRAMGARRRSIAAIFAFSGASLGLFSCLLGIGLAYFTLQNIDSVVHLLSLLQGHEAFNVQFFGQSLPHEISPRAFLFAMLATPIIAFASGLFPAIKAARLNPCEALRSE